MPWPWPFGGDKVSSKSLTDLITEGAPPPPRGQRTGDVDLSKDPGDELDASIDAAIDASIARRQETKRKRDARTVRNVAGEAATGIPYAGDILGAGMHVVRGMAQGAAATRIGFNELIGDKAKADELRQDRKAIDEFGGENLTPYVDAGASIAGRMAYEAGEFVAPGAILGKAAKVAKLGTVAKVLKPASKLGKVAVNTALAAPLNIVKSADRDNSTAGALADLTGNKTLESIASTRTGRGALEIAVDALGNTVGELAHGALRGRKLKRLQKARAEAAAVRAQASGASELAGAGEETLRPLESTQPGLTGDPSSSTASRPPAAPRETVNVSEPIDQVPTAEAANRSSSSGDRLPADTVAPGVEGGGAVATTVPTNNLAHPAPGVKLNPAGQPDITAELLGETPAGRARLAVRDRHVAEVGALEPISDKTWKQPVKTGEELYQLAEEQHPTFWQHMQEWGAAAGDKLSGFVDPGLKPRDSFLDKLARKQGKATALGYEPAEKVGDVLRGSITVKDPKAAAAIIDKIKAAGALVELDDFHANPTGFGYGAHHLQVRLPESGLMAEVQIHTDHGWDARRRLGGHDLYDLYEKADRAAISTPAQLAKLADDVEYGRQLYTDAHTRALAGEAVPTSDKALHYDFAHKRWQIHNDAGQVLVEDAGDSIRGARAQLDALEQGGAAGRESTVLFPGGRKVGVRYNVREAGQLIPSNDAHSFEPRPDYPAGVQGRAYHGAHGTAARQSVMLNTDKLDPMQLLDPGFRVSGPPIVTPGGHAIVGNQRTMMLQRAATLAPEKMAAYRQQLEELAPHFGVDAEHVKGMKDPVLVRELADPSIDVRDPQVLGELNRLSDTPEVKAKDVISEGATRANAMRAGGTALAHFAQTFNPEEHTLRGYLDTTHGREFMKQLAGDGVIQPQELARYVDAKSGTLTRPGKLLVEDMMYGAAIGSPDVVATAPDFALAKLEHAIPAMVTASRAAGWDLAEPMREAFEILNARRSSNVKTVEELLGQGDLLGRSWSQNGQDLARMIESAPKAQISETFRRYAEAATEAAKHDGGADMFGTQETSRSAGARLFGNRRGELGGTGANGVRMMGSIASAGAGGVTGYQQGMQQSEGTDQERRDKALAWALAGAALGSGAPWADRGLAAAVHAAKPAKTMIAELGAKAGAALDREADALGTYEQISTVATPPGAKRRYGSIGDVDLFGNQEKGAEQTSMFGARDTARPLSAEEKAAAAQIPRLKQELALVDRQLERKPNDLLVKRKGEISRELAQAQRLTNRGAAIGADELATRAAAGEGDLFGNRSGAIGDQPVTGPKATSAPADAFARAQATLGDVPLTDAQRSRILKHINDGNAKGLEAELEQLKPPSAWRKFVTLWKAGLLTNPTTHAANAIGNTSMAALETVKTGPAAAVDALLSTMTGARTVAGPTARTFTASLEGAVKGAKEAVDVLRHGAPADELAKLDMHREIDFKNPILDGYTKAIFRTLSATDRVFRGMALERSIDNQARVIAKNEGLRGQAKHARVSQLVAAPTDEMSLRAVSDAEIATFNNNGALAGVAQGARKAMGPIGDIILPFARTPANVASRVAEYSPLGAAQAAAELLVRAFTKDGVTPAVQRKLADRIGRSATGTAAIAAGYVLAAHGKLNAERPTPGSGKADEFDLEGKQSNAILIDGQWHALGRFSPIGNLLTLGAHLYNAQQKEDATPASIAMAGLTGVGKTVEDQSFLRGTSDLLDAAKGAPGATERYLENTAGSIVPAISSRLAGAVDPVQRETNGMTDAIKARIPGLSQQLEPKVDQFGRDVTREDGLLSGLFNPANSRRDRRLDDAKIAELARTGATITKLKKQKGETPAAYTARQRMYGSALESVLGQVLESDEYRQLPQLAAQLVESQPDLEGRDPKELARALQRSRIEDSVRELRRYLTYERKHPSGDVADAGTP